ncbi:hypothetical protein FB45DRAFT_1059481 [Roridomyces roridus]|uniref:F-box domain-containing protein n=1 Tax=Roridomyces roridus TaxID=1738132 RepID=A0AAD7BS03_9AGAR|nr:hypothetical protein FB45DRAFT_1059481 [Roridomyces roridus]
MPMTLNHLAAEILLEVISYASPLDLLSLSTVSRLFHSVATKFLYRHIELRSFRRVFRCCTALARAGNEDAALAVRTLSFDFFGQSILNPPRPGSDPSTLFAPFFRLINAALSKTTLLRSLVLRLPHDAHGICLSQCTFPSLTHYGATFTDGGDFLERHPQIVNITVLNDGSGVRAFNETVLPRLAVFSGPAEMVTRIVPGRPVHCAKLWWPLRAWVQTQGDMESDSWDTDAVIAALSQSNAPQGVAALENLFLDWPPLHVLTSLATSLNLRALFIHSRHISYEAYQSFLTKLGAVLPQFTQLNELGVNFLPLIGQAEGKQLAEEFNTIRHWVTLCPTLNVCALQSSIKWIRFRMTSPSYWIPLHLDPKIFNRVFTNTLWREAFESRQAWDSFHHNTILLFAHLHPGTALFAAIYPHVVMVEALTEVVRPGLPES